MKDLITLPGKIHSSQIIDLDEIKVNVINVTYSELNTLRNNSELIKGKFYRITDYVTTTTHTQKNTQSVNHPFDVIVLALSENRLSEQAFAIQHKGDEYFANSNLKAWELKYCLDNFRFTWADLNGKGVIYYMKDEFGNECPYDFKNIQFKRWKVSDDVGYLEALDGKYMVANYNGCPQGLSVEDTNDFIWAFTFSSDSVGGEQTDYSLGGHKVHHNHFSENSNGSIPNNVFYGENNYQNKFGFDCYNNSWDNSCKNNSWGNNCYGNSCGNGYYGNSWGNNCYQNSCGNLHQNNSWGDGCHNNSCGNNCFSNSWSNDCYNNSCGNDCGFNSYGNLCHNNSCGNVYRYNSWGNVCHNNSCGNNIVQSTLFDGVQHIQISTDHVQNIQVLNGLAGTSSNKLTLNFAADKNYMQVATKTSTGALKIYVPGDLA